MISGNVNVISTGRIWLPPGLRGPRQVNERIHDQDRFFKYTGVEGAICALTMGTLRWSSPLLFNDPFDVPRELSFGVTPHEIGAATRQRMIGMMKQPPNDLSELSPVLRTFLEQIKREVPDSKREAIVESIANDLPALNVTSDIMDGFREQWRTSLPEFRMLCLCEKPDNEVMWCHYAREYKGAVLEFECSEERDSPWLIARKVKYSDIKPDVYTAEGWARFLTLNAEVGVRAILDDATYNKSAKWSYEQEWRITSHMRKGETGLYSDYGFAARDLVSVYLGPRMDKSDQDAICRLVRHKPYIRVFDTELRNDRSIAFKERSIARD